MKHLLYIAQLGFGPKVLVVEVLIVVVLLVAIVVVIKIE